VIGGQTLSLLLTLIATPVVYSLLDDLKGAARWRRFATSTAGFAHGIVDRLKPKPKPRREPAREAEATDFTD
jgi:HAE1 family hydrophobic/amphiphilic exporter-1